MLNGALLQAILSHYTLPTGGTHGVSHWARVLDNGRRLAGATGARLDVVELFAVFHDSQRANEGIDPGHGRRGAELAEHLRGAAYDLDDAGFGLLVYACQAHTDGQVQADISVQTCWDADRLDLPRVGILPGLEFLCTGPGRDPQVIAWAQARAERREVPLFIQTEWAIAPGDLAAPRVG